MTTHIEQMANLVIGSVESVSPNEIRILLELDAPHAVALNTGTPTAFPRINGYILIPNEAGATVAYITWIGIERSPFPKRSGLKDFGLIDLPFPLRKMAVSPVGTLCSRRDRQSGNVEFDLSRGVSAFPSVGDQVLMPTPNQIAAIVGAKKSDRRVRIGSSPMALDTPIMVDPDKLFGRHLAVLGNTGSGKSCTVAGLIRASLDGAKKAIAESGKAAVPNARFIVLDPNGEYARAFQDYGDQLRLFRVPPVSGTERPLDVPAWLWNGHEWSAVAHAQPGVQRPLLLQGIRELKSGSSVRTPRLNRIRNYLVIYQTRIMATLDGGSFTGDWKLRNDCGRMLQGVATDCAKFQEEMSDDHLRAGLSKIVSICDDVVSRRTQGRSFNDFTVSELELIHGALGDFVILIPEVAAPATATEDAPLPFDIKLLSEHIEQIATEQSGNFVAFVSTLSLRIRSMLADQRLGSVIARDPPTTFDSWLKDYLGDNAATNGPLAVIDLSLVPSEVVQIVVAVLARVVFEALQRYRRTEKDGLPLPTVLVLEEAHTFVRRSRDDDGAINAAQLCREAFERIAREGRKFGLGLVLSSQRPSELSPTVLAQCNTFLLHRIVNDADQDLVARLVPDNVSGLLRELPSLPSRQAILLGWATPIPVLVDIDELPESHRPQSSDPDFWNVWTCESKREVDWSLIADSWGGATE